MTSEETTPEKLRPYVSHGLDFTAKVGEEHVADCPFCGKTKKFYVSGDEGTWQCKSCGSGSAKGGGNVYTFLRLLHEASGGTDAEYEQLASERGILSPASFREWGVRKHLLTGEWCIPGYNAKGGVVDLYRYYMKKDEKKPSFHVTWGMRHGMHAAGNGHLASDFSRADVVYVKEGPWDAIAFYEVLRRGKPGDNGGVVPTGNLDVSLARNAFVLAAPGAGVFREDWADACAAKDVVLGYDSDHPRKLRTGQESRVGWDAMKRVTGVLAGREQPPKTIRVVKWGPDGYDPDRKSGWDVRDHLSAGGEGLRPRLNQLGDLLAKIHPVPSDWIPGRARETVKAGRTDVQPLPCSDWQVLRTAWVGALKWTPGLNRALACMLACVASTDLPKTQLWLKVVSPPATGKSTLCEALAVAKRWVVSKSTLRGFHSGYRESADKGEDNSLLAEAMGRTLVTKDGDTLLQGPNCAQVLSEGRDVFDGASRTSYRNKASKEYEQFRLTWILCGTASLRALDSSELGERFIDVVIMDRIDDEMEREVSRKAGFGMLEAVKGAASGDVTVNARELLAKRLTGGYVDYLRVNARSLFAAIEMPDEVIDRCVTLAQFVSFARARPSKTQQEEAVKEFSTRLTEQFVRLACCLTVVLNKTTPDEQVMDMVRDCARDTARGRTMNIFKFLHRDNDVGVTMDGLIKMSGEKPSDVHDIVRFLRRIEAVESVAKLLHAGGTKLGRPNYYLTPKMLRLYEEVML